MVWVRVELFPDLEMSTFGSILMPIDFVAVKYSRLSGQKLGATSMINDAASVKYHYNRSTWFILYNYILKHTTTLFSLSDRYILSLEWRVIVDQVHTNNHGRHMVKISQVWPSGIVIIVGCVLSQLKSSVHSKLWKWPPPSASAFSTTKNVELLGLYPVWINFCNLHLLNTYSV